MMLSRCFKQSHVPERYRKRIEEESELSSLSPLLRLATSPSGRDITHLSTWRGIPRHGRWAPW
jgi:hypothetical protein